MMKTYLAGVLLAFTLALAVPAAHAQGTTLITIPAFDTGRASYMNPNINNMPVTVGGVTGTMWFYPQVYAPYCATKGVGYCGWILFQPPTQGASAITAQVVSWHANTYNAIGQVTSATVNYTISNIGMGLQPQEYDPNADGDQDVVMGSITFTFSYVFENCGRYCTGWHETISGTGQQSITQD
jgi:hypothetical protein